MIQKIISFYFLAMIISCSHVLKIPRNRLSTSETTGTGKAKFGAHVMGASKMETTSNVRDETIEQVNQAKGSTLYLFTGSLSPSENFDIEYSWGGDTPFYLGIKWLLIGSSLSQAKAGSFSLAARIGYGVGFYSETIPPEEINSYQERKERSYIYTGQYSNLELLAGIRIIDPLLFYTGYYKGNYSALVEFNKGLADQLRSRGEQYGYHVGLEFNLLSIMITFDVSKNTNELYTANQIYEDTSFGLGFDFIF